VLESNMGIPIELIDQNDPMRIPIGGIIDQNDPIGIPIGGLNYS